MVKGATATPVRRRGRPKNSENKAAASNYSGGLAGIQESVRQGLRDIVGVCETCGHTIRPVQPVANEIGISPVILAKFIRGEAGVSLTTFDALYGYVEQHKNDAKDVPTEATAEAMAEATA